MASETEKRLWYVADQLRANSRLKSSEYSVPVLGLISLRFADYKFTVAKQEIETHRISSRRGITKADYQAKGVLFLPENARFSYLLNLPEGENIVAEGQRGGEFFTPTSLVKLIVEVIEPYHGRIYDPACGSGGMFVQSANFVERHKKNPNAEISIYGQEKTAETVRLCKMNLAVHGLSGDIRQGNTYYEDFHSSVGKFEFVMANPPFNVNGVDKEKVRTDNRFVYGVPKPDNANYLWIQAFLSALNENGRAGFVMANSASDARQSELEIRKKLIEDRVVDVMIAIGPNFFYTVTLPCTLWFFDKAHSNCRDNVLFIDARGLYQQIDRAHREFTPEQIEFIANIVRLYRQEPIETSKGSQKLMEHYFPAGRYREIPGLCNVATLEEIIDQGYSLNPGRYVGVAEKKEDDFVFSERLHALNEELERLNADAHELEEKIAANVVTILEERPDE